jgi:chorismate synthase
VAGNTFGTLFKVTTFGESHGIALGVTIDGCPAGIPLNESVVQKELNRRRPGGEPGTNAAVTSRKEADECEILSGVFDGKTTGTPIAIIVRNTSQRSGDYGDISTKFRPGHADYAFYEKYGIRDYRGGGRSSGRETLSRVAAGAVAKAYLSTKGISVLAWTSEAASIPSETFDETAIERTAMRACDLVASEKMLFRIGELRAKGDSAGGIVTCKIVGCPPGLGEPVFDKLDAILAHAMLSIGAVKGIEFGTGFESARMTGSEWNDPMRIDHTTGAKMFLSNHAGGVLGGISNGADIDFKVAIKPVPSIGMKQQTVDANGQECDIEVRGRHDACLCPRIVPVVESMAALVIIDLYLQTFSNRA